MTLLPLCEEFACGVHPQCCYTLLQLRYFPISLIRIKGTHIAWKNRGFQGFHRMEK